MDNTEILDDLDDVIATDSRRRRADPSAFFCEVIDELWRDNDEETALVIWRSKAEDYRWYADDALYCLDAVLAAPPADLAAQLRRCGGFQLNHVTPTTVTPYTHDEVVAWVAEMAAKMRAIYAETEPTADDLDEEDEDAD